MNAFQLDGATRVVAIIGDPIAQVKSPAGVTQTLQARGRNAIVMPVHIASTDLPAFMQGAAHMRNLDGIIVTVPHKLDAYRWCATASEHAHFLGGVNVLRRNADGTWHGDHFDGEGYVHALRGNGCEPRGKCALLAGAGGAGSAIALALLEAGVQQLAIHEPDAARRESLLARLQARHGDSVRAGSSDPRGFDLVINATPVGMQASDPLPFDVSRLEEGAFVGDVITKPAVTPLIEAARGRGCATQIGADMFAGVCALMVDFLLADGPLKG
ncbi:shikimate dehydrogenase family protein [Azohydromonas aeria]|uniref:shikimate dehydrogenase family protein n=1 Tax=Azohydromonas aeria TaxID=2590212 RepID=UPI0012F83B3C|nr:shikimate dehydrogenase [Azohydromonas aeria]